MYNVGFGDCFLLFLPTVEGVRKVVLDCGSLKNKKLSIEAISDQLIQDVTDSDGVARIDVLIMTHRHADHISGFTNPRWSSVEVGQVWMPWIESREDPAAKAMRREQAARAAALLQAVSRLGLNSELGDVALNAQSNDMSLDVLHGGFANRVAPRFFPTGYAVVEKIKDAPLPGIDVFVLGPPRDRKALNDPDPPRDQVLLSGFLPDASNSNAEKFRPFGDDWIEENYFGSSFDRTQIDRAASKAEMYELAAAKLDAEINNTSLILIFRIGKEYLLFPGDAQWGPWSLLLEDDDAIALLRKVTFLKVSHHASHNGSPAKLFREILGQSNGYGGTVWAMISMTPYSGWKHIPHKGIIKALETKNWPFVISDRFKAQNGFRENGDFSIDLTISQAK